MPAQLDFNRLCRPLRSFLHMLLSPAGLCFVSLWRVSWPPSRGVLRQELLSLRCLFRCRLWSAPLLRFDLSMISSHPQGMHCRILSSQLWSLSSPPSGLHTRRWQNQLDISVWQEVGNVQSHTLIEHVPTLGIGGPLRHAFCMLSHGGINLRNIGTNISEI